MESWLSSARLLTDDLPYLEFSAPRFLLSSTQDDVVEMLFASSSLLFLVTSDPSEQGPLEKRFLANAAKMSMRAKRLREAKSTEDHAVRIAALLDVLEASPDDLRTVRQVVF